MHQHCILIELSYVKTGCSGLPPLEAPVMKSVNFSFLSCSKQGHQPGVQPGVCEMNALMQDHEHGVPSTACKPR